MHIVDETSLELIMISMFLTTTTTTQKLTLDNFGWRLIGMLSQPTDEWFYKLRHLFSTISEMKLYELTQLKIAIPQIYSRNIILSLIRAWRTTFENSNIDPFMRYTHTFHMKSEDTLILASALRLYTHKPTYNKLIAMNDKVFYQNIQHLRTFGAFNQHAHTRSVSKLPMLCAFFSLLLQLISLSPSMQKVISYKND